MDSCTNINIIGVPERGEDMLISTPPPAWLTVGLTDFPIIPKVPNLEVYSTTKKRGYVTPKGWPLQLHKAPV